MVKFQKWLYVAQFISLSYPWTCGEEIKYSHVSTRTARGVESILSEPHKLRMEGSIVLQRDAEKQKNNSILCGSIGTQLCDYYPIIVTILWLQTKESDSS